MLTRKILAASRKELFCHWLRFISTTVHVSQEKRYNDPGDRPTRQLLTTVADPFLTEIDLLADSFLPSTEASENQLSLVGDDTNDTNTQHENSQPAPISNELSNESDGDSAFFYGICLSSFLKPPSVPSQCINDTQPPRNTGTFLTNICKGEDN